MSSQSGQGINPVSRTVSPASPVWAPFALNVGILLVAFGYRLYNYMPSPTVDRLTQKNISDVKSVSTNRRINEE